MSAKTTFTMPPFSNHWSWKGPSAMLGGAIAALALSSCGTRHSAFCGMRPTHYNEVATSRAMACSKPEVFDNGPEIKGKILELVEQAEDYILLNSFLLSADEDTMEVFEALKRKHQQGVRIYVQADSSAVYREGGRHAFRYLEEAGIPNIEHNPMRFYKIVVAPVMLPRDHRKFWVIDGKHLFMGGANLFPTSIRAPERYGNRDLMVAVESREAVEHMIASFVATWNHTSDEQLDAGDFKVRARSPGAAKLWLADQNREADQNEVVAKMFEGLFAVAKKEIWLIQPYTFTTADMIGQFEELTARGVTVNVMLSEAVQSPRFHYASHYGIEDMLQAGAKVWVYKKENGPMHTKAVMVDRRWVSLGSANFNCRSYHFSNEANLIFGDPASAGGVIKSIDELKRGCREISMEEAKNYRGPGYYFTWLMMQLAG